MSFAKDVKKRCDPVKLSFDVVEPEGVKKGQSPIILLHGLVTCRKAWGSLPQMIADKTKRKVYVPDARNHGLSERSAAFCFDVQVDDLLHFMDGQGIQKAILVGHSMGGVTAMKTALQAGERVEKVLVEDMNVKPVSPATYALLVERLQLGKAAMDKLPLNMDEGKAWDSMLEYMKKNASEKLKLVYSLEEGTENGHGFGLKKDSNGKMHFDFNYEVILDAAKKNESLMTEMEGVYPGEVCVVYGGKSPFKVHEEEDDFRKLFPNMKMVKIAEATHAVHIDTPNEFKDILLQFLSGNK